MRRDLIILSSLAAALPVLVSSCGQIFDQNVGAKLPDVAGARALSRHYIEVTFNKPATKEAENPDAYVITAADSSRLKVRAANLSQDRTSVLLTTDAQQNVDTYTLTFDSSMEFGGGEASFAISIPGGVPEPELDTAIALDANTVLLTLSERMDRESTENIEFYRIFAENAETPREDVAEVQIFAVVLEESTITVRLTTSDLTNIKYTVKMTNAMRGPGPFLINPDQNTQTFFGIRPDDFVPPRLVKAQSTSSTSVLLTFSEPLRDASDAFSEPLRDESDDAGNFTISPTLVVTDAQLTKHNTQILLTTLTQVPDRLYTVTVVNVKDIAGNVIKAGTVCIDNGDDCTTNADCNVNMDCVTSDTALFRGSSRELFLHSAISLNNTQVLLTFSEPMDPDTTACANRAGCRAIYSISDPDGDIDVDIIVESAIPDVGEGDRTVVLNTTSQENILYTLSVRNVKAIRDDFLLDPTRSTATFLGIPAEDTLGPHVANVVATTNSSVLVSFSEPLGGTGILDSPPDGEPDDPSNFRITLSACTKDHCAGGAAEGDRCSADVNCPLEVTSCAQGECDGGLRDAQACAEDTDCPLDSRTGTCLSATAAGCQELTISDGELTVHDTQVLLTTLAQVINVKYTATASNIKDKSGNDLIPPDSGDFMGVPPTDQGPPRVIGAISTSNTTVVVTFSKRMGPSAADPANYFIVQESIQPEAGALTVVSARFIAENADAIQLTTLPQSELTYRVTAVNVLDALGSQLAAQELLVDPTSALFAGTPFGCPSLRHCTNGARGLNGSGACANDDDCDDNPPCGSGEGCADACVQPPEPCAELDSDGDGLPDNEEQRGWVVRVTLTDGTVVERDVTSDPFVADTDADGLTDLIEKFISTDPRDSDTDDDLVPDEHEWNLHFTSPTNQDTDGDGLEDSVELDLFRTSPLLADTDGDAFGDGEEVLELNRDPRVADVPKPRIQIGDVSLRLDTRFSFTDQQGVSRTSEETVSSTLEQSRETSFSFTDTSTTTIAVEAEVEAGFSQSDGYSIQGTVGFSYTQENQTQFTEESRQATQETFERSLTTSETVDDVQEVSREVIGASIDIALTIANIGDIAFTMTNLEVTALLQDPVDRARFIPIATLIPATQLITGEIPAITAGVFVPERGPFIFSSRDVFPTLVEDLLKNPRGLIFKVANFDVLDEFGRNFAFVEQSINERTAGLTIDFGNSRVERFRIATYNSFEDVVRACDNGSTAEGRTCNVDADCLDCNQGECTFATCSNNPTRECADDSDCKLCAGAPDTACSDDADCGLEGKCARALCDEGGLKGRACRIDSDCADTCDGGTNECTNDANLSCAGDSDCSGRCREDLLDSVFSGSFDDRGKARGIRMKSALQDVLGLVENASPDAITVGANGCGETWASGDDIQVFNPVCFAVIRADGLLVLPGPNGVLNSVPRGDDREERRMVGDCSNNPDLKCTANDDCGHFKCIALQCENNQAACTTDAGCDTATCEIDAVGQLVIVDGGDRCAQTSPARDDQAAILFAGVCDAPDPPGTRCTKDTECSSSGFCLREEQIQQTGCTVGGPDGEIILAGPNGVIDSEIPLGEGARCEQGSCGICNIGFCDLATDRCVGGSREGEVCAVPSDCQGGEKCVGGLRDGEDCLTLSDCQSCSNSECKTCTSNDDCPKFCSNNPGLACTADDDCIVDDRLATISGYGTTIVGVCSGDSHPDKRGASCDNDSDCKLCQGGSNDGGSCGTDGDCPPAGGSCRGACKQLQILTRVKGIENVSSSRCNRDSQPERIGRLCTCDVQCGVNGRCEEIVDRFWLLLSERGEAAGVDFDELRLLPGDSFSLAYVQDTDADGLLRREEFLYGTSDVPPRGVNSDGCPILGSRAFSGCIGLTFDSIGDFDEIRRGWEVSVVGPPSYFAFSDPTVPDTDSDRLFDDEEQALGTDPAKRDTDDDGISDFDEVHGYVVLDRDRLPAGQVPAYEGDVILDGGLDNGGTGTVNTSLISDDVYAGVCEHNGKACEADDDCGVKMCLHLDLDDLVGGRCKGGSDNVIRAGSNGIAETVARIPSDDIQVVRFGDNAGANDIVIEPGPNGIIDSVPGDAIGDGRVDNASADDEFGTMVLCFNPNNAECEADTCSSSKCVKNADISCSSADDCRGVCRDLPGGVVILPGPDGNIDSQPGGDDFLAQFHEKLFATDPLNRDTDGDTLFDGVEARLGFLGANPNDPTDAAEFRDDDRDGLVNREERDGWVPVFKDDAGNFKCKDPFGALVDVPFPDGTCDSSSVVDDHDKACRSDAECTGNPGPAPPPGTGKCIKTRRCAPPSSNVNHACDNDSQCTGGRCVEMRELDALQDCVVLSDPFEPDTDFDGLSDLLEMIIGTNPQDADTDGDTVLDFDELDPQSRFSVNAADFRRFDAQCRAATRCVLFDINASQLFGTNPKAVDTDADGRTDLEELFEPWTINVFGKDSYRVFSDPLEPDADADTLDDDDEQSRGTDPTKADTDGDGVSDKRETCTTPSATCPNIRTNPLEPDQKLRVEIASITVIGNCDDNSVGEFRGSIHMQASGAAPQRLVILGDYTEGAVINNPGTPRTAIISQGDTILVFSTNITEDDPGTNPSEQLGSFREFFNFPVNGQLKAITLSDPEEDECELLIVIEVLWLR